MDKLNEIRSKVGPKLTVGLPDTYIEKFLCKDINLALAINNAVAAFRKLDAQETYLKPEGKLIQEIQQGWCHLYPEPTRNPYIPIAAKGPWIVTMYGAVLHDNGGYGMLGFGHSPDAVIAAMSEDHVMANIMTPALAQKQFIDAITKEVGHNRALGCPFAGFLLMNSGSEGNSVADRLIDIHTGHVLEEEEKRAKRGKGRKVKCISLEGCFHGRTYRPALWTDSCVFAYTRAKAHSIVESYKDEYCWKCKVNDCDDLQRLFDKAAAEGCFIEAMFLESVMGEGNPGVAMTPQFYNLARSLTLKHDGMLLVDNIQAGLRTTGNLSITDYPGFEALHPPDFEVYSKAVNAGQYPVSVLALSERAQQFYRHGVYGNTMTGNPRACAVSAAVLSSITPELRKNIVDMGHYAVQRYRELQAEFPDLITNVQGTGLLYSVQLNQDVFSVVAEAGAEFILRSQGIGVIHGGTNALRFTPHFAITPEELDMQIDFVRTYLNRVPVAQFRELAPRLQKLRRPSIAEAEGELDTLDIKLHGHLFDNGSINKVLNMVESHRGTARMLELKIGENAADPSDAHMEISAAKCEQLLAEIKAAAGGSLADAVIW